MPAASGVFSNRSQYSLVHTVNQVSQNIAGNYSTDSVDLRINESPNWGSWSNAPLTWSWNVAGQTASGSTTYDFRNYDVLVLSSTTRNISHNADGTKTTSFSASAGGGTTIGSASCSGSFAQTTIPRASTPSFSPASPDIGTSVTINTNRASSSFTHEIAYSVNGGAYIVIASGVGASTSWDIPDSLNNSFPNSTSGTVTIRTRTYSGGTLIGTTTKAMTVKVPTSVVPDFGTITHSEATPGVASNVGAYVQGITKLNLAITGAVGAFSSTIVGYKIEVIKSGTVLQTINAVNGVSTPIQASGTVTLRGTVTDSRGRTKQETVNITLLAWAPPVLNAVSVQRALSTGVVNDEGTYFRVNINASVSSLVNTTQRNALNYRIFTRSRGSSTWTLKTTVTPGGLTFNSYALLNTYSITEAYEVLVEVYDDFVTTAIIITVPVAAIFMHWDAGDGVGIGKYRENGTLDVKGSIYADNYYRAGQSLISLQDILYITSDTTFKKGDYPWLKAIRVKVQAGGGAGGSCNATAAGTHSAGGGGGGGGYAESFITDIAGLNSSIAVTVGAGGTPNAGAGGGAGGTSSFGSLVSASGGGGGGFKNSYATANVAAAATGGGGGSGTAGDIQIGGQAGGLGQGINTIGHGGFGGSSQLGGGAAMKYTGAGGGSLAGEPGKNYGGGGSGACGNASGSAQLGGAGAPGIVIIELYA